LSYFHKLLWFKLLKLFIGQGSVPLTLGYAFAPLMIVGGLSQVLEFFFIEYYHNIVNSFSQAFGLGVSVEPWQNLEKNGFLSSEYFHT